MNMLKSILLAAAVFSWTGAYIGGLGRSDFEDALASSQIASPVVFMPGTITILG
jgi:hypothetical protein